MSTIDLSRLPLPAAIELLDYEALFDAFADRFLARWNAARAADPTLPEFDVAPLQTNVPAIVGQAWSELRLLDRQRVNDAVAAVLAPFAQGADLDAVSAGANVARLVVVPADPDAGTAAVMESDASLLLRYLLSFDRPAAGSVDGLLHAAWTAWPLMGDARVNGFHVHHRRGDTDLVIIGPAGRLPTEGEADQVRAAVYAADVRPEAIGVAVIIAERVEYAVNLVIEIPNGPDANLIVADATARVRAAADARTVIGGEVPVGLLAGAAYGANVIRVRDLAPVAMVSDPYVVPVCTAITIIPEVRA